MTWSRSAALLLAALPFMAAPALAGTPHPVPASGEPYELVRSLQTAQDDTANGNAEAHGGHLVLIRQIGEKFLSADPAVWSNPRNGQAVIVFMLSGGAPQIVRKLPRDRMNVDERLFNGALAYVEGRQDEAKELLKTSTRAPVPSSRRADPPGSGSPFKFGSVGAIVVWTKRACSCRARLWKRPRCGEIARRTSRRF